MHLTSSAFEADPSHYHPLSKSLPKRALNLQSPLCSLLCELSYVLSSSSFKSVQFFSNMELREDLSAFRRETSWRTSL